MTAPLARFLPTMERARGAIALTARRRDGRSVIGDLTQSGCGRVLFPTARPGGPLEAVVVNTSGGLTGGDRFSAAVSAGAGTAVVVTTQACEKVYRSDGTDAIVSTKLALEEGSSLAFMPQETILFDRARLVRRLDVEMAHDAMLLVVEAVLLGRKASGESLTEGLFRDSWRIRRGGTLIFAEEMRLCGDLKSATESKAILDGAAAFAIVAVVTKDAPAREKAARAVVTNEAIGVGISSFDGLCVARLVAQDGVGLRASLIPLLRALGGGVPRVWSL